MRTRGVCSMPATEPREARIAALAEKSSYVENVLTHALVAGLAGELWRLDPGRSLQVFNSEVDDSGFDVILGVGAELRYIQLKQAHDEKVPAYVSVRLQFSELPGSCVVLMSHRLARAACCGNCSRRFPAAALRLGPAKFRHCVEVRVPLRFPCRPRLDFLIRWSSVRVTQGPPTIQYPRGPIAASDGPRCFQGCRSRRAMRPHR
jgi:hypothetical protein